MTGLNKPTTGDLLFADAADWLFAVAATSQRFICHVAAGEPDRALHVLSTDLPESPTPIHGLVLRCVLARVVLEYESGATERNGKPRVPRSTLERTVRALLGGADDPKRAFERWASRRLLRENPPTLARLAASRWAKQDSIPVSALARSLSCSERSVRTAFSCTFGLAPRAYRRRARVLRATELLRNSDLKTEAVALELGFRSPKNLYRALKIETGLTPRRVRGLPEADASVLLERLSMQSLTIRKADTGAGASTAS